MSDTHTVLPPLSTDRLTDQFIVQRAGQDDLPAILAIYNQSIAGKQATANLVPVTTAERVTWFEEHFNSPTRPLYVVKTISTIDQIEPTNQIKSTDQIEPANSASIIVAWGSFSDLYQRTAYHISSEISVYLHQDFHGRGLGNLFTRWMLTQAPSLEINNVIALVFAHNKPSLGLFNKLGFDQWGYMPQVCDMQGFIADVVMLGKAIPHAN